MLVVLALAMVAMAVGLVIVAVVVLLRQARGLSDALRTTTRELDRLTRELGEESAVLSVEAEAVQRRLAEGRRSSRDGYTSTT